MGTGKNDAGESRMEESIEGRVEAFPMEPLVPQAISSLLELRPGKATR